jgi:hypothetical protein
VECGEVEVTDELHLFRLGYSLHRLFLSNQFTGPLSWKPYKCFSTVAKSGSWLGRHVGYVMISGGKLRKITGCKEILKV